MQTRWGSAGWTFLSYAASNETSVKEMDFHIMKRNCNRKNII